MKDQTVLIIGEPNALFHDIFHLAAENGFIPRMARASDPMESSLVQYQPSVVISVSSQDTIGDALRPLREIRRLRKSLPVIFVTQHGSEELAVAALRAGASDYYHFRKSDQSPADGFLRVLGRQTLSGHAERETRPAVETNRETMVGDSPPMREIKSYLARVARSDSTVLITGETGTGKELAAQTIHRQSIRCSHPFVSINCAAIPEHLVESELFGYERGAFTGALRKKPGKFLQV